jgi:chorismate synthase
MRVLTSGESHGLFLTAIIEGIPANLDIDISFINSCLKRRQWGFGRGQRMGLERDEIHILSGIRNGKTLGSPLTLQIKNRDKESYEKIFQQESITKILKPRPGHCDLAGAIKYNQQDIRNILERASARETAIRTAVGAVAMLLLRTFDIEVVSSVISIGTIEVDSSPSDVDQYKEADNSLVRCHDKNASERMVELISQAKTLGYSLGGIFQIAAFGVPVGIGSHSHWDRKLDYRLAGALMSLQGIKGVEIGTGFKGAALTGQQFHDDIFHNDKTGYHRKSNNAGGIEGGISNGMPIVIRCAMKPIPTMAVPKYTVDMENKKQHEAFFERTDVCAVPSASVIAEAIAAWEIAVLFMEKFGGDSIQETQNNYENYIQYLKGR